jgi:hypothetical protein
MRPALTNSPLYNPFNNRFNDPVTRRHDDMQAYAYTVWLRERNQGVGNTTAASSLGNRSTRASDSLDSHAGRTFGVFALFLVFLVSVGVLLKVF